jgi:hypothetical protein
VAISFEHSGQPPSKYTQGALSAAASEGLVCAAVPADLLIICRGYRGGSRIAAMTGTARGHSWQSPNEALTLAQAVLRAARRQPAQQA